MPAYTFAGTVAAALIAGYQPYILDIDRQSLGLDPARLLGRAALDRAGAIIFV